jgi:hypothetical protein
MTTIGVEEFILECNRNLNWNGHDFDYFIRSDSTVNFDCRQYIYETEEDLLTRINTWLHDNNYKIINMESINELSIEEKVIISNFRGYKVFFTVEK